MQQQRLQTTVVPVPSQSPVLGMADRLKFWAFQPHPPGGEWPAPPSGRLSAHCASQARHYVGSMKSILQSQAGKLGFTICAAFAVALTGCVHDHPPAQAAYRESVFIVQDDYV